MEVSVEEMAALCGVTPKTIREWIRLGMPVTKKGGKGAGQGARVDVARFAGWDRRFRGDRKPHWSDGFHECYPGRNPFRSIAWQICADLVHFSGVALREWADQPELQGKGDYRPMGLTQEQSREIAWKTWFAITMMIFEYHDSRLESRMKSETGCDFDSWLSFLLQGDFHTQPTPLEIATPPQIRELLPDEFDQSSKAQPKRRAKRSGR